MVTDERGGGWFEEVELWPRVTIDGGDRAALATELHKEAHELWFIANS